MFGGSFKIARLFNIPVKLHWSFLLLFPYIYYLGTTMNLGMTSMLFFTGLVLALFVCVTLHEFGHSLTARYYGIDTKDIILSPIGGLARLNKMPEKPMQEFVVAVAGPLVNVVIFVLLGATVMILNNFNWEEISVQFTLLGENPYQFDNISSFLMMLGMLNMVMVVFNLIPAFPMDGGRMFRALMSALFGKLQGTSIASFVGQGIAVIFFILAIYYQWYGLGFIGVFIFMLARNEHRAIRYQSVMEEYTVDDVYRREFTAFSQHDAIGNVTDKYDGGLEKNFLIMDNERNMPIASISEAAILLGKENGNPAVNIMQFSQQLTKCAYFGDSLGALLQKFNISKSPILPVINIDTGLVGVVEQAQVIHFIEMNRKMKRIKKS